MREDLDGSGSARRPARIGVIGAGFGQNVHVPAFRLDDRCEVVAICANSAQSASRAAERTGIPRSYGSFREMLDAGEIDAVSIAVPPAAQCQIIVAAAEAGKHIFCEKPVSTGEQGAQGALEAAEKAGVVHAVDFIFPEIAAWQQAFSILQQGTLGKLRHVALTWRVETYAFAKNLESWKTRREDGGGVVNNFLSHSLYYLEWLFGPFAGVAARILPRNSRNNPRVEAWFETESNCPVTVSIANDAFLGSGHRLEVYGETGSLILNNQTSDYVSGFSLSLGTRQTGSFSTVYEEQTPNTDGRITAVSKIVHRFLDAVLSGTSTKPNLADGVRVQHLIAMVNAADESGKWQRV
jgi:predicted dehydrogenase